MDEDDLRAFEPILIQEIGLGVEFNVNFCRNPMCPNFGPAPNPEAYRARYTVESGNPPHARTYKCNFCEVSWPLLSNRSLRTAYAWFKHQSIPFATCPGPGCDNEGLNVFEYCRRYCLRRRLRPSKTSHMVRCPSCGSGITLGEPTRLRGDDSEITRRLEEVFRSARDRGELRDRVDNLLACRDFDIGQSRYLRTLASLAPRLRDYHSYCNAELLAENYLKRFDRPFGDGNDGEEPGALPRSPFTLDGSVGMGRPVAVHFAAGRKEVVRIVVRGEEFGVDAVLLAAFPALERFAVLFHAQRMARGPARPAPSEPRCGHDMLPLDAVRTRLVLARPQPAGVAVDVAAHAALARVGTAAIDGSQMPDVLVDAGQEPLRRREGLRRLACCRNGQDHEG